MYDLMINKRKPEEAAARFMAPAYIQHNPLIADGAGSLGKFFGQIIKERTRAWVDVQKIVAVGDYVWSHMNFLNLFNDDPQDTGIAGVDIFRMHADAKTIDHCDVLQLVATPKIPAHSYGPHLP